MDAIVMLREDHKNVERLFREMESGDLSVVPRICEELTIHATIEEELFYPLVKAEVDGQDDTVLEAVEEHHVVRVLIDELAAMTADDEEYEAKATVLMENVRHHIEEEESELFPAARAAMGRKRLQELGERMDERRGRLATA